jgi:hypothetical protein
LGKKGIVDFNDLWLFERLEKLQGTYVNHLNRLKHKLLEELQFNDAEEPWRAFPVPPPKPDWSQIFPGQSNALSNVSPPALVCRVTDLGIGPERI